MNKFDCNLKTLLQSITQPEYYGDVLYRLRKLRGSDNFSDRFTKLIRKFVNKGYLPRILQRTAYVTLDPFTVKRHSFLFCCAKTGQSA